MAEFNGFSEEDLKRIKYEESDSKSDAWEISVKNKHKKILKIGGKPKTVPPKNKSNLKTQNSDEAIDQIEFDKCRLSLKSNTSTDDLINNNNETKHKTVANDLDNNNTNKNLEENNVPEIESRKNSIEITSNIEKCIANYAGEDSKNHKLKLEELQLQQKLMEEQNKKRKEMLAKALADRTKQTEEEVLKLEKIKKELQVLDGQFSQDVAVLRKKIDHACLSYADAEKHYLKVEKEFLQAKINLQKEKDKKELLTEHLCALITHNETRKAQKLETLMLQLATDRKNDLNCASDERCVSPDEEPVIIDGVDQKTGKIVELTQNI